MSARLTAEKTSPQRTTDQMAPKKNRPWTLAPSLAEIYRQMSPRRKRQFFLVLLLMVLGAVAELVMIGAILPFLSLLVDPDRIRSYALAAEFIRLLGLRSPGQLVLAATILFAIAAIAAGAVRLALAYGSQTFAFRLAHDFGVEVHRRMLSQRYSYHIASNTSQFVAALEKIQLLLFNVLIQLMLAFSAAVISVFIIAALIYIDPLAATAAGLGFGLVYLALSALGQKRLNRNSDVINRAYAERVQAIQESLGGIRDIILDQSQSVYVERFRMIDDGLRRAQAANAFIAAAPRFALETAGMVLIAFLAYFLAAREGGLAAAIPVLGALTLGAQRLLPLLHQVYYGWASVTGTRAIVLEVVKLLKLPVPEESQSPPLKSSHSKMISGFQR